MRNDSRAMLGLVVLAAAVHGIVLAGAWIKTGAIDHFAFQSVDCGEYYAIAKNVLDHGVFSQDEQPPFRPDTWRTPGYPLFLAAVMAVAGKSPTALIVVQQLLGVLNTLLVFGIARRWMSPRRAALVSGLFLLEPYHLYYTLWLMSTTLQTTLVLAIWYVWSAAPNPKAMRTLCALGVLCALLVLIWPGAVLVPIFLFVGLLLRCGMTPSGERPRWGRMAAMVAGFALVVGGWMARNAVVGGRFALSHQSGIVLAYFKAAEVELWREGRTVDRYIETSLSPDRRTEPHPIWEAIDRDLRGAFRDLLPQQKERLAWFKLAQGNRTDVDSFRVSSELAWIGIKRLLADPWSTLACGLTRCAQILTFPLDLAIAPPKGVSVSRLRSASIGGVYALLVGWVLYRLIRYRKSLSGMYFPLVGTVALLLAATPQTDPRFRVPMIPLLLFLALLPGPSATDDPAVHRADRRA